MATLSILSENRVQQLTEIIAEMTVPEVLALHLAVGPTKFVTGPLVILLDMTATCNLIEYNTYLLLAQGRMETLISLGKSLNIRDQQDYS